ncbi:MAG: MBL fold metallo-hydrolase [Salinirussus sp.]
MKLTFLGTGSAMPTGDRMQTGLLLQTGGKALVVDCGSGALHSLARTSVGYAGADTVLLTHHHLDHVSDLMPLLKARWLDGETELTVVGPPGTSDLVDGLLSVHEYMQDRVDLTLRDLEAGAGPYEVDGFDVAARETQHSMQCYAYRFTESGREGGPSIVFSGDTEADPGLVSFADGAAVLVHDCSFPDDVDVSNHPTPASLGQALAEADVDLGRVYLTHFYPHSEGKHDEMLESIGERYDGDVRVATDGLTLDFVDHSRR